MTTRDEFEATMNGHWPTVVNKFGRSDGLYTLYTVELAWAAWQAATERAAKVCRNMGALEAMEGEEYGSAAMVRVADRQAELCAAAIEKTT